MQSKHRSMQQTLTRLFSRDVVNPSVVFSTIVSKLSPSDSGVIVRDWKVRRDEIYKVLYLVMHCIRAGLEIRKTTQVVIKAP